MDLDSHPDVLLVRKHLVEHLGRPEEVFEVRGNPLPSSPVQSLHLSYFAPGGAGEPVVFATCGACLYAMKDGRRVEALMLFRREPHPEAFEPIRRMLASFALFAETHGEVIRIGDVVRASTDLRRFSSMEAVLFLPPVPFVEAFHRIALTQNRAAEVIWLLPVYEPEAAYALKHGPQALMMLFAAQGLDLTDMDRDEANTLIQPEDARTLAAEKADEDNKGSAGRSIPMGSRAPRRSEGARSYEVVDDMNAVTVVRRGAKAKPRAERKEVGGREPLDPDVPSEEHPPRVPSGWGEGPAEDREAARPPPIRRRPLFVSVPQPEPVIRFDLGARDPKTNARRQPIAARPGEKPDASSPRTRKEAEVVAETPEAKAEAKRKRVLELKAKAADIARRREQVGNQAEAGAVEPPSAPPPPSLSPPGDRGADSDPGARPRGERDQRHEPQGKGHKGHGGERK